MVIWPSLTEEKPQIIQINKVKRSYSEHKVTDTNKCLGVIFRTSYQMNKKLLTYSLTHSLHGAGYYLKS
jgi:hypothetical protein